MLILASLIAGRDDFRLDTIVSAVSLSIFRANNHRFQPSVLSIWAMYGVDEEHNIGDFALVSACGHGEGIGSY